jgi:hypothetical protein
MGNSGPQGGWGLFKSLISKARSGTPGHGFESETPYDFIVRWNGDIFGKRGVGVLCSGSEQLQEL